MRIIDLLKYGLIAFPLAFVGLPIYLHAPDFYATQVGLSLGVIGFALLALRLVDAVQDPLIGFLSDRYHRHRPLILMGGAFMLSVGLWMLFHPVNDAALLWLCLSVFICTTGFSIVSINVNALGGLWHVADNDVTKIMGTREGLGLIGLLTASITPPILFEFFDTARAFHLLSLGFIPLIVLCVWGFLSWLRTAPLHAVDQHKNHISFHTILKPRHAKLFFSSFALSSIATAIPGVLIIFYVRDYLGAENYLGLFLLVYFLSGAAAMPLWHYISRKISVISAWRLSMVLAAITFVWVFLLAPQDVIAYGLVCLFSGMAVGANLALPPTIIANIMAAENHQNAASRYYALMALIAKMALAVATGVALPILDIFGYQAGIMNDSLLLPAAYGLVPIIFQIMAIYVCWLLLKTAKNQ